MNRIILITFLLTFPFPLMAQTLKDMETVSNCLSDESIIFSCRLENKKILSVCGSSSKTDTKYVEYRYGKISKIEFKYRAPVKKTQDKIFLLSRNTSSGLPSYTMYFQNKKFGYALFVPYNLADGGYSRVNLFVNEKEGTEPTIHFCESIDGDRANQLFQQSFNNASSQFIKASQLDFDRWIKSFGAHTYEPDNNLQ